MKIFKKRGFTLIELLVTISILGIISAIGFAAYSQSQIIARDGRRKQDLKSIALALEIYKQKSGHYPCSGPTGGDHITSYNSKWLTDLTDCGGTTEVALAPDYINKMPKDPSEDSVDHFTTNRVVPTKHGYAYFSYNGSVDGSPTSTCPKGQYYMLITILENGSDKDAMGYEDTPGHKANSRPWCGFTLDHTWYGPKAYIIAVP